MASAGIIATLLVVAITQTNDAFDPAVSLTAGGSAYWHGTCLGGWLVMEINPASRSKTSSPDVRPSWMFDQISAASELAFVTELRAHSDEYAIRTMRNHWEHYISDEMLDAAAALGVDTVRIPLGYWITDTPVGGSSPLEYGLSPEGFVTGGLNHLASMLPRLRARGMLAVLDMHALPCNSACVSDGLDCANPLAFAPPAEAAVGAIPRCTGSCLTVDGRRQCDGQAYQTTRERSDADGNPLSWGDVGLGSVSALAAWVAALPPEEAATVVGLQLANEPALNTNGYDAAVKAYYTAAVAAARVHLPSLPLLMSFIPPNDYAVPGFVQDLGAAGGGTMLIDHHWYLNWASAPGVTLTWPDMHRRACHEAVNSWQSYTDAGVRLVLGEWSLAVNHDAQLDIDNATIVAELRQLFAEQLSVYANAPAVRGAFYWTLRMGSGWDPRPGADGGPTQLDGTSAARSLPDFPFKVWSLLEMARAGVVTRIDEPRADACANVPDE